jgi:hypothetical protein
MKTDKENRGDLPQGKAGSDESVGKNRALNS